MDLICEYKIVQWKNVGKYYSCCVTSANITKSRTKIRSFNGSHLSNGTEMFSYPNVGAIWFKDTVVESIPEGLIDLFPNYNILCIENCGLRTISKENLLEFKKLKQLYLPSNKLTFLPVDLFASTSGLEIIDLKNNLIDQFDAKAFESVKNTLKAINLMDNPHVSVDFNLETDDKLENFLQTAELINEANRSKMQAIENAAKEFESTFAKFEPLFVTGKYSDFTIEVLDTSYKVHKNILAAQSSVFEAMFTNDNEDESQSFKKILNFSGNVFEDFLRFFYTRKVKNEANAMELIELARDFDVPDLTKACAKIVLRKFEDSQGPQIYNMGYSHSSEEFKTKGFEAIQRLNPEIADYMFEAPEAVNMVIQAKKKFKKKIAENGAGPSTSKMI